MRASAFKPVPVQVVGQSYEHRSSAISVQKTDNLMPIKELTGAAETSLTSWYGSTIFCALTGTNRGFTKFAGTLYKVTGNTLYSIDSSGTATSIGAISGTNRCIFANDGTNLMITTGGTGYQYTGSTLSAITDTDFESANSVAYMNQTMFYDGNGGQFQCADIGDPDSFASNNFATAEGDPDNTIRVYRFKENLYVFGDDTVEPYYYTGSGNPPVARIRQGKMDVGLKAIHSVASSEQFCYFLGSDRQVYRFSQLQAQPVSSVAVAYQISIMDETSDCIGSIYKISGQTFYVLNCPTGNKTFAFSEESGAWFNLSTGADQDRYIGEDFIELYGKLLICGHDGSVYELDRNTFTDSGTTRIQERIFGPILPADLGIGASRAVMSRLWLHAQAGVGLITGQGENPQIMCSVSVDGGETWSTERDVLLGRMGQGRLDLKYDHMTSFRTLFVKLRVSDPVFFSLFGGTLEIQEGGI